MTAEQAKLVRQRDNTMDALKKKQGEMEGVAKVVNDLTQQIRTY